MAINAEQFYRLSLDVLGDENHCWWGHVQLVYWIAAYEQQQQTTN